VYAMFYLGELFDKDDPQRFVWLGRAAANGNCAYFLNEMRDQFRNLISGTGRGNVVFVIGRALKGHIDNEKRTVFGDDYSVASASQIKLLCFTNFNCDLIEEQSTAGRLLD
jgi:hypothetical protein